MSVFTHDISWQCNYGSVEFQSHGWLFVKYHFTCRLHTFLPEFWHFLCWPSRTVFVFFFLFLVVWLSRYKTSKLWDYLLWFLKCNQVFTPIAIYLEWRKDCHHSVAFISFTRIVSLSVSVKNYLQAFNFRLGFIYIHFQACGRLYEPSYVYRYSDTFVGSRRKSIVN